jgi:hypothetical protein
MEMDPACQQWKFHSGIVRLLCEQSALKVPPIAEKPRMTGPCAAAKQARVGI